MQICHDTIWKGVTTTFLGITATLYGLAGRILFAATAVKPVYGAVSDTTPITMAGISTLLGFVTTIGGAIWTWFLLQKAKATDARREEDRKDADAERDRRVDDRMADIQLMVAEGLAKIQLEHAKVHASVQEQTAAIQAMTNRAGMIDPSKSEQK
jgi:tRNA uridine 5-carbamoylmethylation protein Kti12